MKDPATVKPLGATTVSQLLATELETVLAKESAVVCPRIGRRSELPDHGRDARTLVEMWLARKSSRRRHGAGEICSRPARTRGHIRFSLLIEAAGRRGQS
jgi:hypothetical protein